MLNSIIGILSPTATGVFDSIQTVTVGAGGATSIDFNSIPQTYTHLQIRYIAKDNQAGTINNDYIQINGDSGSNYTQHRLIGNGSAASSSYISATTSFTSGMWATSSSQTPFNAGIIDILDYTNTNKYKTFRSLNGADLNGSGQIVLWSGVWMSTAAITSIKLDSNGQTMQQYSQFALYGIKGA